jgi:dihydrodipicolinate synthase/N-acetylneuraminate lyase
MVGVGTGVHAMSITPFDRKGAIDSGLLRAHLRFLAAAGVGVYVASQGSGEGDLLSFDEKVTLYAIAAEELRGRVPVAAAGIGLAASTAATRELAVAAEVAGVDAVQILAPRPRPVQLRDDELETHLRSVIETVRCDVHLSSNTALAGYELPMTIGGWSTTIHTSGWSTSARGRVEHLGVDAVAVHFRDPGAGVVTAGAEVLEP